MMLKTEYVISSFVLESWLYGNDIIEKSRKHLDLIIDSLSEQSHFFQWKREIVFRLRRVLQVYGINPCSDDYRAESKFTLSRTLLEGEGNCLGLTTLYIAIGEILGLPFRPVLYEGHVAIALIGESPFYFDATRINAPTCVKWAAQLKKERHQILDSKQFVAVHLSNQSKMFFYRHGLTDDAVFLIDSALELFPDYTAGWINRAAMMKKLDNAVEMRRSLDMARSLNPGVRYTKAIEQIEGTKYE